MTASGLELVYPAGSRLGECPRWDSVRNTLWWVDIDSCTAHELEPGSGEVTSYQIGVKVGALAPRCQGGAVLATADGFAVLDTSSGSVAELATITKPDDVIMNDGACDLAGRFWAGTVAADERPGAGTLYRLDPDASVRTIVENVTISNGLAWSPDARLMYYVDSATQAIDVFDFDPDEGRVTRRRRFVEIPAAAGVPDGLAVDDAGCVWVALWGGSAVHRYAPDGRHQRTIAVPTPHVTACAFGGSDGTTLFITTAAGYLAPEQRESDRYAGHLYAVDPAVTGPPANSFAG